MTLHSFESTSLKPHTMAIANHTPLTIPSLLSVIVALASTMMVEAAARHWLQLLPRLDNNNTAGAPPKIHDPWDNWCCCRCRAWHVRRHPAVAHQARGARQQGMLLMLKGISERCIIDVFTFPFNPLFLPSVKCVCSFAA
jgi:hypothetical protein